MLSISRDKDGEDIEAFNSTSRYLDYLLNIDKYTEKRSFGNKESNICKQQTILRYGQSHLAVRLRGLSFETDHSAFYKHEQQVATIG